MKRPTSALLLISALVLVATQLTATQAFASPPSPPSLSVVNNELAAIPTQVETGSAGYSRDLFPHWSTQSPGCDTREIVLQRDGIDVVTSSTCAATSAS